MSQQKVFVTELTANDSSAKEVLGTLRWEGAKCYKYIKFSAGSGAVAAVANECVVYHGDDGMDDVEVTMDVTDGTITAGVLQAVLTATYYGWIQIKGYATLNSALTAGADNNALTSVGAGDGTLDVSAAVTDFVSAVAIDASAKKVLLDCPW
jgi:hypothetical protein